MRKPNRLRGLMPFFATLGVVIAALGFFAWIVGGQLWKSEQRKAWPDA